MEKSKTKVVIKGRLSYAHIWKPGLDQDGTVGKYSTAVLIPKDDEASIKKINDAIKAAAVEGKSKLANKSGKIPPNLKTPLRDADEEGIEDEAYQNHYFLNASSKTKPGIVYNRKDENGRRIPVEDENDVYSGCYCYVSINFYAFAVEGNKGIAAGLNNIMKIKDGDRLSGGASADEDFGDIEAEEEDTDSMFD